MQVTNESMVQACKMLKRVPHVSGRDSSAFVGIFPDKEAGTTKLMLSSFVSGAVELPGVLDIGDGPATIERKLLFSLVDSCKDDFELEVKKGELHVTSGTRRAKLPLTTGVTWTYSAGLSAEASEFVLPPGYFDALTGGIASAAVQDEGRGNLRGVWMHTGNDSDGDFFRGMATDGRSMISCKFPLEDGWEGLPESLIVPCDFGEFLVSVQAERAEYDDTGMACKGPGWTMSTQFEKDAFLSMPTDRMVVILEGMWKKSKHAFDIDTESFNKAMTAFAKFTSKTDSSKTVTIERGGLLGLEATVRTGGSTYTDLLPAEIVDTKMTRMKLPTLSLARLVKFLAGAGRTKTIEVWHEPRSSVILRAAPHYEVAMMQMERR